MIDTLRKNSAFTLVEMIAAVVLVSVIFFTGTIGVGTGIKLFMLEVSKTNVAYDIAVSMEWIRKDAMLANYADVSTANEVTFDIEDFSTNPSLNYQVRYYVKPGTAEFYRLRTGDTGDGKLLTDMIDLSNLPVFTKPAGSNFLFSEMWVDDTGTSADAHRGMGVRLCCRRT